MKFTRVVIVGQCTIDDIHLADGRCLPETPGGAATYAVLGAVMYGAQVCLVTLLGDDYPFERFRSGLPAYGMIDLDHVRWAGARSIHNVARYRSDGARRFDLENWDIAETMTPTPADLPAEVTTDAAVLLTACSLHKQLELTRVLRKRGCPVAIDTELHYFSSADEKQVLRQMIGAATFFLPSIEHLQLLFDSGSEDIETYAERLCTFGCPWVVVKRGALGSTLIDGRGGQTWHVPAVPDVVVMDPTGAGDGFDGGFLAALADGKVPLEAACWGAVTASFVVESVGAVMPAHFTPELALHRFASVRSQAL